MAIRVLRVNEKIESPTEDWILVRYYIDERPRFMKVILGHKEIIEGVTEAKINYSSGSIQRAIHLIPPDNPKKIRRYRARVKSLVAGLEKMRDTWVRLHLHKLPKTA